MDYHDDLARYVRAFAGAGFVVVWMTLGVGTAVFAAIAAVIAARAPRLVLLACARRARPRRRPRPAGDPLPLVPDEPSLILTAADF